MDETSIGREVVDAAIAVHRGFRADIIVEGQVILELKSVERVSHAHKKQLLTDLKLTGLRLGFLLNVGEAMMKNGITRTVNGLPE
jgi:GxxExxY protein